MTTLTVPEWKIPLIFPPSLLPSLYKLIFKNCSPTVVGVVPPRFSLSCWHHHLHHLHHRHHLIKENSEGRDQGEAEPGTDEACDGCDGDTLGLARILIDISLLWRISPRYCQSIKQQRTSRPTVRAENNKIILRETERDWDSRGKNLMMIKWSGMIIWWRDDGGRWRDEVPHYHFSIT